MGTYDSDDIVAKDEADVTMCVTMYRMTESEFEALIWKKALT